MNLIHHTAIIEEHVELGEGNTIGPYVVIRNGTFLGDNNYLSPFVVIGEPPEHMLFAQKSDGKVFIGDRNVIHEHVVIQKPLESKTQIGNDNLLMHGSHVGHDVTMYNKISLAPNVVLAGHVKVGSNSFLGIGTAVHQRLNIAPISMIGMNSTVTKDTVVASMNFGTPCKFRGWNRVGLSRLEIDIDDLTDEFANLTDVQLRLGDFLSKN